MSCQIADHAEFTARYSECDKSLRRFVAARFHASVQDEVVSEAWYQAWRHYGSFRGECAFLTWLFSIARHVGLNVLRHRRRYREKLIRYSAAVDRISASHENRVIAAADLQRIFRGAPAEDVRIVRMLSEGYTSDELGRMTRTTAGAIRQRRFRAMSAARQLLRKAA